MSQSIDSTAAVAPTTCATDSSRSRASRALGPLAHLLFWSWNAVFLAVVGFGIVPLCVIDLFADTLGGRLPWTLFAAAAFVVLVPLSATLLGAIRFARDPARLFGLFYAVEAPLFLLALGRLFLVRALTPGVAYVLVIAAAGIGAYLVQLLRGEGSPQSSQGRARAPLVALALAGDTAGLWAALYAGALLAFFAVPAGWALLEGFYELEWVDGLYRAVVVAGPGPALLLCLGALLFFYSATLFVLLPPVLFALYARRFAAGLAAATARLGAGRARLCAAAASAAIVLGFLGTIGQPQQAALSALAAPPGGDPARRALLEEEEALREGLLNAYLAPFRYLDTTEGATAIRHLYAREIGLDEGGAEDMQAAFNAVASPFLYDGKSDEESRREAADRYARFFDRSIQRGEREAIAAAREATWSREDREAGLLAEGERRVWAARQEVRVEEHGDWAEIELHEVYENQTADPLEVLYYFSLPETAAITGLWLGQTEDRAEAFSFTVSPRGAAQRVYRAEVTRRRDPALIEQVGPRQYRLRAFPIPPRPPVTAGAQVTPDHPNVRPGSGIALPFEPGPAMHLWLRYRTLAQGGAWPLPRLSEERNVFRDERSQRTAGGQPLTVDPEIWLPPSLPAAAQPSPRAHRVRLDKGLTIVAAPEAAPDALPEGRRFAVVLDRSYSMRAQAARAAAAMQWIRDRIERRNRVDLYLTAAPARGESARRMDDLDAFDAGAVVYYGGQDPAEMLDQFSALRGDTHYDGIVVLTDEGGFDLCETKRAPRDLGAPLWMVHLGGGLAAGYDDATLATIQRRGGGAAGGVEEAFSRLAGEPADPDDLGWADGYRFRLERGGARPAAADEAPGFDAIAAHHYIPIAARAIDPADPAGLDRIHAIARAHEVVSPYSSMIVLVDEAQRQALREAEAQRDRYDRDVERGETALSAPSPAFSSDLTGTPEPEEWVLLALTAIGLGWAARRRRILVPA